MAKTPKDAAAQQKIIDKILQDVTAGAEEAGLSLQNIENVVAIITKRFAEAAAAGANFDKTVKNVNNDINSLLKAQKEINEYATEYTKQLRASRDETKKIRNATEDYRDAQHDIRDLQRDLSTSMKAALKLDEAATSYAHTQLDLAREAAIVAFETGLIDQDRLEAALKNYDATEALLDSVTKLRDTAESSVDGYRKFGLTLDDVKQGFDGVAGFAEKVTGGLVKSDVAANLLSKGVEMLGPKFAAALGPIGLVVMAVQKMYAIIGEINQQTREFGSQTGLSFQQSEKLVKSSMKMAGNQQNIMSTQKEILAVQGALVQEFGTADAVSDKTVQNLSNMSKVLGISEKDAAGVQQVLMQNAGASEDMALGVQQAGANLAEAAGVPIGEVMKDLAESGEEVAKYFAGMPKEAMKTAVQLKAMGLNMKTAAKMADGLLDIETSLKAEAKAQIMLGKSINLDKARQLAAEGDIAGAAKAATKEIGNAAEFAKMDQFQKKAAAEAAGLTVEELSKSYAMQERQAHMSKEQRDAIEKYGDALGDVTKMDDAQLQSKITSLEQQEKFAASMENLKTKIMEGLMPLFEALGPIFSYIGMVIENVMIMLDPFFNVISNIFSGIKSIFGGIIKMIKGDFMGGLKDLVGGLAKIVLYPFQLIVDVVFALINVMINGINELGSYVGFTIEPLTAPDLAAGVMSAFDDAVIPPTGQAGKGYSRVLSGPEGSVALNDKDTIVAGTNLGGGGGGGGGMDIGPLVAAIQQTNALLSQMVKSPPPVLIGDEALRKIGRNVKVQNSRGA